MRPLDGEDGEIDPVLELDSALGREEGEGRDEEQIRRDRVPPESILRTTRDPTSGLLRWLFFAPHNIGYHVVHHLHPQVAYESLPGLRRWYVARYPGRYPLTPPWWPGRRRIAIGAFEVVRGV